MRIFWDGSTGKEAHNKYTLLYARTIYEASVESKRRIGNEVRFCGAEADTQAARIIRQTGLAILPQQKIIWQQY